VEPVGSGIASNNVTLQPFSHKVFAAPQPPQPAPITATCGFFMDALDTRSPLRNNKSAERMLFEFRDRLVALALICIPSVYKAQFYLAAEFTKQTIT
jgi:hypothetical protein